jgi:hypothetical protein
MFDKITKFQEIRVLYALISHADAEGKVDFEKTNIAEVLGTILSNSNHLGSVLYELDEAGIIEYAEIGEDGFEPIIFSSIDAHTFNYLSGLIEFAEKEHKELEAKITDLLSFNPKQLTSQVEETQKRLNETVNHIKSNELLTPLQKPINEIQRHFESISMVSKSYEDIYKNIIRPVQDEGKAGVQATVKWAILGIFFSTAISVIISNWKELVAMFANT